jgi:hypothetical protein
MPHLLGLHHPLDPTLLLIPDDRQTGPVRHCTGSRLVWSSYTRSGAPVLHGIELLKLLPPALIQSRAVTGAHQGPVLWVKYTMSTDIFQDIHLNRTTPYSLL